ncbi:hypothetical protein HDU85_001894 [Gaertneriomyces sp. JEL0708]|nr:hypothetical protein HDU85_001894 [Gaertneriomyces sp. JEL0708]
MDLAHLDVTTSISRRIDRDFKDLVTRLSIPPTQPNSQQLSTFFDSLQDRVNRVCSQVDQAEGILSPKSRAVSASECVDAATEATMMLQGMCDNIEAFMGEYGYVRPVKEDDKQKQTPRVISGLATKPKRERTEQKKTLVEVAPAAEPSQPTPVKDEVRELAGTDTPESTRTTTPPKPITHVLPKTPQTNQRGSKVTALPDSPLASLEDFGISDLALGVLRAGENGGKRTEGRQSAVRIDSPALPKLKTSFSIAHAKSSTAPRKVSSVMTPELPKGKYDEEYETIHEESRLGEDSAYREANETPIAAGRLLNYPGRDRELEIDINSDRELSSPVLPARDYAYDSEPEHQVDDDVVHMSGPQTPPLREYEESDNSPILPPRRLQY